jgi:hypothetical protein
MDVLCIVEAPGFPGGDVAVDADILGPDYAQRIWHLDNLKAGGRCEQEFVAADPTGSWICHGMLPGTLTLAVPKAHNQQATAGIRWG